MWLSSLFNVEDNPRNNKLCKRNDQELGYACNTIDLVPNRQFG